MPDNASDWQGGPKRLCLGLLIATATPAACAVAQVAGQKPSIETGGHRITVQTTGQVDHTVLMDNRVILHDIVDEFVALRGPYVGEGRTYLFIDENAGGNACGGQFQAVEIKPDGTSISPAFGNCNDAPIVSVRDGALHVTTPSYRGLYSAGSRFIAAESVIYRDGKLLHRGSK